MALIRFVTVFFTVFVIFLAALLFQAGLALDQTVLDASYYRQVITESALLELLHEAAAEELTAAFTGSLPDFLVTPAASMVLSVYNQEWLEEQLLRASTDLALYLGGERERIETVIDLRPKNEELLGRLTQPLAFLPPGLLDRLGLDPAVIDAYAAEAAMAVNLPAEIAVEDIVRQAGLEKDLAAVARVIHAFRLIYPYAGGALFLVGLGACLFFTGAAASLRAMGSALFLAGAVFSLPVGLSAYAAPLLLALFTGGHSPLAAELLTALLREAFARTGFLSLVLAILGGFIFWAGLFFRRSWSRDNC